MSVSGSSPSRLPHSLSSPSNMENSTLELPDQDSKPSKMLSVQIHFLDGTIGNVQIQMKAVGRVLFEQVCKMLSLLEVDYFGLEYTDETGIKYWLDYEKPMFQQLGLSKGHPVMYFSVKFYTPDPAQLEEEYTRYLYSLQLKRDLAQGCLQCNDNTAALMASYIVQSECGDYSPEDYPDHTYLSSFKFVPQQEVEIERKIMDNHKKHVGQTPSEADLNLLETARRCELYGIKMTPAKDNEGVPLNLASAHMGVLVFQNYTKINTFSWAKIRKLSFKRKRFIIKLHPEGYGFYKDSVDFIFDSRNECKNFWKKCIENHAFFRCAEVKKVPRQKTRIFSRGSSFRYSGRTQKQIVEFVRENYVKRQPFQRSTSLRVQGSSRSGVGSSISAQPLLPVSSSQSCGSVILTSPTAPVNASPPPIPRATVSQPVSPTSSHQLGNGNLVYANANGNSTDRGLEHQELPPGLEIPNFNPSNFAAASLQSPDQSFEGLQSPDFLADMTDDNISHDSYLVEDKASDKGDNVMTEPDASLVVDECIVSLGDESMDLIDRVDDWVEDTTAINIEGVARALEVMTATLELESGLIDRGNGFVGEVQDEIKVNDIDVEESNMEEVDSKLDDEKIITLEELNGSKLDDTVDVKVDDKLYDKIEEDNLSKISDEKLNSLENGDQALLGEKSNGIKQTGKKRNGTKGEKRTKQNGEKHKGAKPNGEKHKGAKQNGEKHKGAKLDGEKQKGAKQNGEKQNGIKQNGDKHIKKNGVKHNELNDNGKIPDEDTLNGDNSNEELSYILRKRHISGAQQPAMSSTPAHEPRKRKSRVRVEVDHPRLSQGSPTLFLRASRLSHSSCGAAPRSSSQGRRTMDFVSRHHLPAMRSFSSQDDSLDDDSFEKELFEHFRKLKLSEASNSESSPPVNVNSNSNLMNRSAEMVISNNNNHVLLRQHKSLEETVKADFDNIEPFNANQEESFEDNIPRTSSPVAQYIDDSPEPVEDSNVDQNMLAVLRAPPPCYDSPAEDELLAPTATEEVVLSDTASEASYSHSSDCSDEMRRLSDAQLYETHLVLSEDDLGDEEEDEEIGFETHTEEIYFTINSDTDEGVVKPNTKYAYGSYKFCHVSSLDDGSTTEAETVCDDASLNDSMEILEDITEQTEAFSEEETQFVACSGESLSTGRLSAANITSLPVMAPRSHRTYLELEVTGGAITERAYVVESPTPIYLSPSHDTLSLSLGRDNIQSETTSLSARGLSSDSEAPRSPISPMRSWRDGGTPSNPASPRSDTDTDSRRKRYTADRAYYIAKELLMTERTYKRDLELINVWFRDELSKEENMPTEALSLLFHLVDPMYECHCAFLRALEQRIAAWDGKTGSPMHHIVQGVGDVMLEYCNFSEHYDNYVEKLGVVLERLNTAYKYSNHFTQVYRDFEIQKVCYLPLTSFLLRPCHRLQHYCLILERLTLYYSDSHPDYRNCKIALTRLQRDVQLHSTTVVALENAVKLMELQRDLVGLDNLIIPGREFLREGCLQKLSRKGYQQRMFFLFSDILLYTSRASTPHLQFKVHGQVPLQGVMVEATEPKMGINFCFNIYGGSRALMVAASSESERIKWLDDLSTAVTRSQGPREDRFTYSSLHSCSSSDELSTDKLESPLPSPMKDSPSPMSGSSSSMDKHLQHRSNTTVHVCWHRNTSVGRRDYRIAMLNYLSGNLLRKFKNSSGWQKLWVVFTNFCLFFYKSYQDDFPLASLPLLGYSVNRPSEHDNIQREYVFKLQFKNHIYFFRAESDYTFSRWMEVISSATLHR